MLLRVLKQYPLVSATVTLLLAVLFIIALVLPRHPSPHSLVNAADVSLTATPDLLATATVGIGTPPLPTNTPDPLATATPSTPPTATAVPPPSTATPAGNYQVTPVPMELHIDPTTESGTCAEGKLAAITITDIGSDPISWNASADQGVDLNPNSSVAAGQSPMTPGQSQRMGFSFGVSLSPGTTITVTIQQTSYISPPQTETAGTVTITCT